jgi:hypothetical protein
LRAGSSIYALRIAASFEELVKEMRIIRAIRGAA